jgi:hypothetical protein
MRAASSRVETVRRQRLAIADLPHLYLRSVYDYWRAKAGSRFAPARREIDPTDLRETLPRVLLVDVQRQPWEFRYRLAGTETTRIHGLELTGRTLRSLQPPDFGRLLHEDLVELATTGEPQFVFVEFINQVGLARGYHVLRLPLSSDGETVDMILIVSDFGIDHRGLSAVLEQLRSSAPAGATEEPA